MNKKEFDYKGLCIWIAAALLLRSVLEIFGWGALLDIIITLLVGFFATKEALENVHTLCGCIKYSDWDDTLTYDKKTEIFSIILYIACAITFIGSNSLFEIATAVMLCVAAGIKGLFVWKSKEDL